MLSLLFRLNPTRNVRATLRTGLIFLATIAVSLAAEDEPRFSSTLTATQRTEAGFAKLSDDNIAVIDALVRSDEAAMKRQSNLVRSGNFSQRRSAHEMEITALAKLSVEQRNRLDELIAQRSAAAIPQLTAEVGAPPVARHLMERNPRVAGLELHGSVSLAYGWSKEGSVRGGEMVVTATDPSHRLAITVGYSEYRGKGFAPYYDPNDDFYRYRPSPVTPVVEP
jgi:hypothetical protein